MHGRRHIQTNIGESCRQKSGAKHQRRGSGNITGNSVDGQRPYPDVYGLSCVLCLSQPNYQYNKCGSDSNSDQYRNGASAPYKRLHHRDWCESVCTVEYLRRECVQTLSFYVGSRCDMHREHNVSAKDHNNERCFVERQRWGRRNPCPGRSRTPGTPRSN